MDDLIEQLRDANPEPRPDPIEIGFVWAKLTRLDRSTRHRPRLRRARFDALAGSIPGVLAVGISALVVLIVGVALHGRAHLVTHSRGASASCSLSTSVSEQQAVQAVVGHVQLLRTPVTSRDIGATACTARAQVLSSPAAVPTDPGYRLAPSYLRYVGPGILGGRVFMYALPGVPRAIASRGLPPNSTLAPSETEPSVCVTTVGGYQAANPNGCTNLKALLAGPGIFGAAQIPGTATSVLAGVVRDGVTAVRVYDGHMLIDSVAVQHNFVQLIVDHNAPAAARLRFEAELGTAQPNRILPGGAAALTARVKALHGHPIVINIWNSTCVPCRHEFPVFTRAAKAFGKTVAFLGADYDEPSREAGPRYLLRHTVSFPSYATTTRFPRVLLPRGVEGTPTTIFISAAGTLTYIKLGEYASEHQLAKDIRADILSR